MRSFNFRMMIVVFVVLLIGGGAVWWLHGLQMQRQAAYFLEKARAAAAEKDFGGADGHYLRYLQLERDDLDALAEHGLLQAEMGRDEDAFATLEEALRADPDRTEVRRKLVDVLMRLDRYPDAYDHLRQLLRDAPKDGELLELSARCLTALGRYADADKAFQQTIESAPEQFDAYRMRAELLRRRLNRPQDADECMRKLVEKYPNSTRANVLYGDYLRLRGKVENAAPYVARAVEESPDDLPALELAVRTALDRKRFDEARRHAMHGIQINPKSAAMYHALADVEVRMGKPQVAIAWLRDGIKEDPGERSLLWQVASLYIEQGELQPAAEALSGFEALGGSKDLKAYLQGRMEYAQGNWQTAAQILEQARPGVAPTAEIVREVDYWLGRCYEQLGDAEAQMTAYRRAISVDPMWVPARLSWAAALSGFGRNNEAIDELRQVMNLRDAPAAGWAQLARLLIGRNLRMDPAARDWKETTATIDQYGRAEPGSPELPVLRAELLIAQDKLPEAETVLEEARAKKPDEPLFWLSLTALARRRHAWERADEVLRQAEEKFGDKVYLRLARARLLADQLGAKAADDLNRLGDAKGLERAERLALWRGLASCAVQIGALEQICSFGSKVEADDASDMSIRLLLLEIALRTGKEADAERQLEEIRRIEGEGGYWHYGQAVLLGLRARKATEGRDDMLVQAQKHVDEARRLRPNWTRAAVVAGDIALIQGKSQVALGHYLDAIERGEQNPAVLRSAVQLLYQGHRYGEADKLLRRLPAEQTPPELDRMATQLSLRLEDLDRALETAGRAAARSKDYRDHLWLALIQDAQGQRALADGRQEEAQKKLREAEQTLRTAVQMRPDVSEVWVTLIRFLARTGQDAEAGKTLAEAEKKLPAEQAPLAEAYEVLGKQAEAQACYETAMQKRPDDPLTLRRTIDFFLRNDQPEKAEPLINTILEGRTKAEAIDTAWARRQMATIQASRQTYPEVRRALELVEENLKVGTDPQDQRMRILLLAMLPTRPDRRKAIESLEEFMSKHPDLTRPDDRLVLAQLYAADGEWSKANQEMRGLIGAHGKEPRYLAAYVETLLKRQDLAEAELWLKRLLAVAPQDATAASLAAEAAFQRGRYDEALSRIQDALADSARTSGRQPLSQAAAAEMLEDFSRRLTAPHQQAAATKFIGEAESLLRQHVEKHPAEALRLTAFIARRGRVDEALRGLLAEPDASPDAVAQVIAAIVTRGAPTTAQVEQADRAIHAALERHNRAIPLLLALGELRTAQGRFSDVEAAYREILQREPDNLVAMNNLAVLLALSYKNLAEALTLARQAVTMGGPVSTFLDTRAMVYLSQDRNAEAIADLQVVVTDVPRPNRYFHLAQAYHTLGQKADAAIALTKAKRQGLRMEDLHPLERPGYRKLLQAYP